MKTKKLPAQRTLTALEDGTRQQWLTLGEASDLLGVHYSTLRSWADKGEISVFRTPGGHRRFGLSDIKRFLEERAGYTAAPNANALINVAVGRVRQEIERLPSGETRWRYELDQESNDQRRARGRQLFGLAIAYVLKAKQRERLVEDGRSLGWEYGKEAAAGEVGLKETGRAVQFFRSQLIQTLHVDSGRTVLDADDLRVQDLINQFLDEVLYAVLEGYEHNMTKAARADIGQSSAFEHGGVGES